MTYSCRSASDHTSDWPYWYITKSETGNLNITVTVVPELRGQMPFLPREECERTVKELNES
jgi:Asp-tRNA(Asn)/Glu-tRNA(Gln) amidotransferase B subunit